jgi:hypothetical protein
MKSFSKIQIFAGLIIGSILGLSYSGGVDDNKSGHPLDILSVGTSGTCGDCHSGGTGVGSVSLTGVPTSFTPGQIYPLTLTITDNVAFDAGFQLVAVSGTSSNAQVGTFMNATAAPFTRITAFGRLTHGAQAPINFGTVSWNFSWVAPSNSPPGQVYFYYATNAVNDNDQTDGDTPRNGVSSSVPLPIDLLSFGVEREDHYLQFEWTTQTEKNADRFEIESSADGRQFQVLDSENATGNSDKPQQYVIKIFKELQDTYFRLKMIDLDGSFRYSEIIFSKPEAVLPKLHMSNHAISVTFPEDVTVMVDIYDLMGRAILHDTKVNTNSWTVETHHYPKGVYVIRISGHDVEKFAQKFVIQ